LINSPTGKKAQAYQCAESYLWTPSEATPLGQVLLAVDPTHWLEWIEQIN
jgi:hypothetical protein